MHAAFPHAAFSSCCVSPAVFPSICWRHVVARYQADAETAIRFERSQIHHDGWRHNSDGQRRDGDRLVACGSSQSTASADGIGEARTVQASIHSAAISEDIALSGAFVRRCCEALPDLQPRNDHHVASIRAAAAALLKLDETNVESLAAAVVRSAALIYRQE